MRKIEAACIRQIIVFSRNDKNEHIEYAERKVQEEIERYMHRFGRCNIKYKVISEEKRADGSVQMEIVKEYGNRIPVGTYLD